MGYEDYIETYGINLTEKEAINIIKSLFELYEIKKGKGTLYHPGDEIPYNIINLYMNFINKKDHTIIYENYKYKFISNESIVEPGITKEEIDGIENVYNYISIFQKNTPINVFIESFKLHAKLYEKCPHPEFGTKLREDTAVLYDTPYEVLPGDLSTKEFNKYISKTYVYQPSNKLINSLNNKTWVDLKVYNTIFKYINDCIIDCVNLIKLQPFDDGNKRTFRALLNLLFKQADIPPIYIKKEERDIYKRELLKAICDDNYEDIIQFYYYKIADSIISLGINKNKEEKPKELKREKRY